MPAINVGKWLNQICEIFPDQLTQKCKCCTWNNKKRLDIINSAIHLIYTSRIFIC